MWTGSVHVVTCFFNYWTVPCQGAVDALRDFLLCGKSIWQIVRSLKQESGHNYHRCETVGGKWMLTWMMIWPSETWAEQRPGKTPVRWEKNLADAQNQSHSWTQAPLHKPQRPREEKLREWTLHMEKYGNIPLGDSKIQFQDCHFFLNAFGFATSFEHGSNFPTCWKASR